jgi:hypothetical protein
LSLRPHLGGLPDGLADALDESYREVVDHYLLEEWDDAQVDAGHFCEAALRYLEYKMTGTYTAIDGKAWPNRKRVVQDARADTNLADPSLRAQVPQAIELAMDFRNNRNVAHLGSIDANQMDAACVMQVVSWLMAEIVRIETDQAADEVQSVVDQLAERQVPTIQTINGRPIILDRPDLSAEDKALVHLLHEGSSVPIVTLREWVGYSNSTRWRERVLGGLVEETKVHVDEDGMVHLLRPGQKRAEQLILGR